MFEEMYGLFLYFVKPLYIVTAQAIHTRVEKGTALIG